MDVVPGYFHTLYITTISVCLGMYGNRFNCKNWRFAIQISIIDTVSYLIPFIMIASSSYREKFDYAYGTHLVSLVFHHCDFQLINTFFKKLHLSNMRLCLKKSRFAIRITHFIVRHIFVNILRICPVYAILREHTQSSLDFIA